MDSGDHTKNVVVVHSVDKSRQKFVKILAATSTSETYIVKAMWTPKESGSLTSKGKNDTLTKNTVRVVSR